MSEIKGFLLSLMAAASVSALMEGFVPEGGGIKKYVKYLISLTLLLTLLIPLRTVFTNLPAMAEGAFSYDSVEAMSRANAIVALHIQKAVCEKFAVADEDAAVRYEDGGITVEIRGRMGLLAEDIVRFCQLKFGITPEVTLYE